MDTLSYVKKPEVLAIIPARGGSKGIPGKNIKDLAGKPLIAYTIDAAHSSKYITRTVLSTEDVAIKKVALSLGVEVIDRPAFLAQDETKTAPVMLDVIEQLEKQDYFPDVVILLQATCPLRDSKQIDEAFEIFLNPSCNCDSVFAVKRIGTSHAIWKKLHDDTYEGLYDYRNRPRRQDIDKHFDLLVETGSIYIVKTDVMKKVKDFIGEKPQVYYSPSSIDIDTLKDFEKVETILNCPPNCQI